MDTCVDVCICDSEVLRGWVMDRRMDTWISGWKDAQMGE